MTGVSVVGNIKATLLGTNPASGEFSISFTYGTYDFLLMYGYKGNTNNLYNFANLFNIPPVYKMYQYPNSIWTQTGYNTFQTLSSFSISFNNNRVFVSTPYDIAFTLYRIKIG